MSARTGRITWWAICLIAATIFFAIDSNSDELFKEKTPFYVCAPSDMEEAFEVAVKAAGMKSDYKIVITDNREIANVVVDYAKENDETFTKFVYTPFVVAYSNDSDYLKKLQKNNLITESNSAKNVLNIDVLNLIEIIKNESDWEDYGIDGFEKVKVAYPSQNSIYWNDFYNFMLVTVNNGVYPSETSEYEQAVTIINEFLMNKNAIPLDTFETLVRKGFTQDILYIGPEKVFVDAANDYSQHGALFYPTKTVYFNYYLKTDELGSKILSSFDAVTSFDGSFYGNLVDEYYRSESFPRISTSNGDYVGYDSNAFDVADIPKGIDFKN